MRAPKPRPKSAAPAARHGRPGAPAARVAGEADRSASPHLGGISGLSPEIEAELCGIAAASGCELLHVEWKGGVLRLILDRVPPEPPAAHAAAAPMAPTAAPADAAHGDAAAVTAPTAPTTAADGDAALAAPPADAALGVSLGDCEYVAKQAGALLDVLDFGRGRYTLEVSSPGLDRQLFRPRDYRRFLGHLARVTFETGAAAANGRPARRTVVARLAELHAANPADAAAAAAPELTAAPPAGAASPAHPADTATSAAAAGDLTVVLVDDATGERLSVPLSAIRLARLEVEL